MSREMNLNPPEGREETREELLGRIETFENTLAAWSRLLSHLMVDYGLKTYRVTREMSKRWVESPEVSESQLLTLYLDDGGVEVAILSPEEIAEFRAHQSVMSGMRGQGNPIN